MKRKNLLFKFLSTLFLLGVICSSGAFGQAVKTHSYTFEDGTFDAAPADPNNVAIYDQTGNADGVMQTDGTNADISNGTLNLTGGVVGISGGDINLSSYTALSIESVFTQEAGLGGFTCIWSAGAINPAATWMGINYVLWQPTRNDNDRSRTSISCGNTGDPWATENGVNAPKIADTELHYAVTVVTDTDIKLYIDGILQGSEALSGSNALANIANDTVFIGGSIYTGDPRWHGSIDEINIYNGELSPSEIASNAFDYLGVVIDVTDPTLSSLTANKGTFDSPFDPATDTYILTVPFGTATVTLTAMSTVTGAKVEMFDGDGVDISATGQLTLAAGSGFAQITVTALDGSTSMDYFVLVQPEGAEGSATLKSIDVAEATAISPTFDPDVMEYTAILPAGTTSATVSAEAEAAGATVTIPNGGVVDVTSGSASVTIHVESQDQTTTLDYIVNLYVSEVTTDIAYYIVNEQPSNNNVLLDGATLNGAPTLNYPDMDAADSQIWKFVDAGAGQVYIQNQANNYIALAPATPNDYHYMVVDALPGVDLDSAKFELDEFEPGRFYIRSVARMASASPEKNMMSPNDTYVPGEVYSDKSGGSYAVWNMVAVGTDNTLLDTIAVDPGLVAQFNPLTLEYYVTIPQGTTSVDITAVPQDATASVSNTGAVSVSDGATVTLTVTKNTSTTDYMLHFMYPTLMHSYTFEDGTFDATTVQDQVGSLDGTLNGAVSIAGGMATVDPGADNMGQNYGYISFDGAALDLASYSSITTESYIVAGDGTNDDWSMMYYFGNNMADYTFCQMSGENPATNSYLRISATGGQKTVAKGNKIDDGQKHHIVATASATSLKYYVDGALIGEDTGNGLIVTLGTQFANLFRGPDGWNDDNWIGSFETFNIYEGELDAATIAANAEAYVGTPTAITTVDESSTIVYPTVSSGSFTVKSDSNSSVITVYSLAGTVVSKTVATDYVTSFTVPSEGMYIVQVESDGKAETFKVIKQ